MPQGGGGAGLQFREGHGAEYLDVPSPDTNKGWHSEWFYTANHEPRISTDIDRRPIKRGSWAEESAKHNMLEVRQLVGHIAELKTEGLTGVSIATNFVLRRIQPLKARTLAAYEYAGKDDFNREAPERLDKAEACSRLAKFFVCGTSLKTTGGPQPFSLGNPHPVGRLAYYSRPPLPEHPCQVGVVPVDPIAELY
ncbi:unnamed protein product [Urochloa humidicola]